MRFSLHTRHRSVLVATGEDARELDEMVEELPAESDKQPFVAGPPSADLMESPGPGTDWRQEPYDDRGRRHRGMGFTS